MPNDLKNAWKETGKGIGHAFRDLGKTLLRTGAVAAKKAEEWANSDDNAETATENKTENKPE